MKERLKTIGNFLLRFGLSGALLYYLYTKIDVQATKEVLQTANIQYLTLAFLVFVVINFILLWRWFVFIRALDLNVSVFKVIRFFFIGLFGNLFLPSAIGGDLIKIIGLCKDSSQKPRVVASVLLDRLSGFAGLVIVAILTFVFGFRYIDDTSILILIVLMGTGAFMFTLILFNERIYSFGCKTFNALPKFKKSLMDMHYDISLLKGRAYEGFKALGISCLSHTIFAFDFYLIAKALQQDISFVYFLIFVPMICVASSFPSIGGLGVREAGAAYLFGKIGVESGVAVSISLIVFLFMVLIGLFGGIIYVVTFSSRRVQHTASDASVEIADS